MIIPVKIERNIEYSIFIKNGGIKDIKSVFKDINAKKALILTDTNVGTIYAKLIIKQLNEMDICPVVFEFLPGEKSKNLDTVKDILTSLHTNQFSRTDVLITLGGGVSGDIGGFCAAVFKRGIKCVQIPTSLLAQIDSSVGGKTGVDFEDNKNSVGVISQPYAVICDPDVLKTLPDAEIKSGMGEMIKYACIEDKDMFFGLQNGEEFTNFIENCIRIKADIIMRDEMDLGERLKLNFGHTLGHAIEVKSNYNIAHGLAVAIGMAEITKIGEKMGVTKAGTYDALFGLLKKYSLPYEYPDVSELLYLTLNDKKVFGDELRVVMLEEIGKAQIKKIPRQTWIS